MSGSLHLVLGPMFAGKTTELLRRFRADAATRRCILLKPAADTRYAASLVVSHLGDAEPAVSTSAWPELPEGIQAVYIDELQFWEEPMFTGNLPVTVLELLSGGTDVTACGLDTDWRRELFPVVEAMRPFASTTTVLHSACGCGEPARWTTKISGSGDVLEVGGAASYAPACDGCFH